MFTSTFVVVLSFFTRMFFHFFGETQANIYKQQRLQVAYVQEYFSTRANVVKDELGRLHQLIQLSDPAVATNDGSWQTFFSHIWRPGRGCDPLIIDSLVHGFVHPCHKLLWPASALFSILVGQTCRLQLGGFPLQTAEAVGLEFSMGGFGNRVLPLRKSIATKTTHQVSSSLSFMGSMDLL